MVQGDGSLSQIARSLVKGIIKGQDEFILSLDFKVLGGLFVALGDAEIAGVVAVGLESLFNGSIVNGF